MSTSLVWVLVLVGCLVAILEAVAYAVSRRLDNIRANHLRSNASIVTKCMMREGAIECPGVAQVADGMLILTGLVKSKRFEIPLSQIVLLKEATWWGKGKRWGKRAFHLEAPGTQRLILGVKDAAPWRRVFGNPKKN